MHRRRAGEVDRRRYASRCRLREAFEDIYRRYAYPPSDDDEIALLSGKICATRGDGFLAQLPRRGMGDLGEFGSSDDWSDDSLSDDWSDGCLSDECLSDVTPVVDELTVNSLPVLDELSTSQPVCETECMTELQASEDELCTPQRTPAAVVITRRDEIRRLALVRRPAQIDPPSFGPPKVDLPTCIFARNFNALTRNVIPRT